MPPARVARERRLGHAVEELLQVVDGPRSIARTLALDGARPGVRLNPPKLGEHNAVLLAGLGYSTAEIATFGIDLSFSTGDKQP